MSRFKTGDIVLIEGNDHEFRFEYERETFYNVSWPDPDGDFNRVYANLPKGILVGKPKPLPVGTILRDGEGDLWVAFKPGLFNYITMDGEPVYDIDLDDLETVEYIREEYHGYVVLFNPED